MDSNRYIPVPEWNDHHPWPSQGGLRWLIFNKHKNGFDTVVRKVGRRVLISEEAFFDWIEAHGQSSDIAPRREGK